MSDIKHNQDLLRNFGLSEIEAKIYLLLVKNQSQTILEIASNLNLPRTSVYDNVQKLLEKGLVERIVEYKSYKIRAMAVDFLGQQLTKERERIEILNQTLDQLKKSLENTLDPIMQTQMRYYKGVQGLRQMMWNALSAEKETIGYSVFGRIEIIGKSFQAKWVQEFRERKLRDRVITNLTSETSAYLKKYVVTHASQLSIGADIRVLDKKQLFVAGDTTIYNDTFAVCYWKEGEVVGFEIENPSFVRSQKTIFEMLWQQAIPINEKEFLV